MSEPGTTQYVVIDAHQECLSIAVLEKDALECEDVVSLTNRPVSVREWFRRLTGRGFVVATYEAGGSSYDWYLKRLSSDEPACRRRERAGAFLRRTRVELRRRVSTLTGKHA